MKLEDLKALCGSFRKASKVFRSLCWLSELITVNLGGVWVKCEEHDHVHEAIFGLIHAEGKWLRAHTDRY